MQSVPLTHGKVALVDDADYELVSAFPWRAVLVRHTWYAETYVKGAREYLHRFLLGAAPKQRVDHRNGDGLDNQRDNLRLITSSLNQANRRRASSASKYKGVTRRGHRWRAYITVQGQFVSLGSHTSAEDAARAYDRAAREMFGEFACTNEDLGLLGPLVP